MTLKKAIPVLFTDVLDGRFTLHVTINNFQMGEILSFKRKLRVCSQRSIENFSSFTFLHRAGGVYQTITPLTLLPDEKSFAPYFFSLCINKSR